MDTHFDGLIFQTHPAELARRLRHPFPPFAVLDVRASAPAEGTTIPGSISWRNDPGRDGFPEDTSAATEFFLVGEGPNDPSVRKAALALKQAGARRVVEVSGGVAEWRRLAPSLESRNETP